MSAGTHASDPAQSIPYINYQLPPYSTTALIIWSLLTAIVSLSGNCIILIGTIKHNAIKLDKLSLVLIKNLAVSDILNTLLVVIPGVVTLHTREALFQDNLLVCTLSSYVQFVVPIFNSLVVCALTVNKLMILLDPLKTLSGSDMTGYFLVLGAWICGLVPGIEYLIIGERDIVFDTRICRYFFFYKIAKPFLTSYFITSL